MGKLKAKNRRPNRPHSSGKPSVKNKVLQQRSEPTIPALEKVDSSYSQDNQSVLSMILLKKCLSLSVQLSDASFSERQWACHSMLHLMRERENREQLVRGGVVGKVAPLLVDQHLPVREAAASLLR